MPEAPSSGGNRFPTPDDWSNLTHDIMSMGRTEFVAVGQVEPPKPPRFVVKSWRAEDGLPGEKILRIARTREGFIYVGTTNGLAQFDGVRFRSFTLEDGLRPGRIGAIHEDRQGNLWVGTVGGGLATRRGPIHLLYDRRWSAFRRRHGDRRRWPRASLDRHERGDRDLGWPSALRAGGLGTSRGMCG